MFFCMSMIMIAVSLFLCTIVVHFYFRAETFCKMPYLMKKVTLGLNIRAVVTIIIIGYNLRCF
jgi:hypothetical protein